jgi:mannose-6-phosphate isomerase-like protein (cupin superfamily)
MLALSRLIIPLALLAATPALAQEAPPVLYASKADIAAAAARAKAAILPGRNIGNASVLAFGSYSAILDYRIGPVVGAVHESQIELFQVVEGSGTLTMGGTLEKGSQGDVVKGGTDRHVAAGDVFVVPAGVPHAFTQVDGHLVLLTLKLPAR